MYSANNTQPTYPYSYRNNAQNMQASQAYGNNDDRFIAGGFLGPFILGGITGGLLAPAFYGSGGGRPTYNTYYYPYPPAPYPYYGPYYGPYYR